MRIVKTDEAAQVCDTGLLDAVREMVAQQVGDEDEEDVNNANVMQDDVADSEENSYAKK